jgi:hypothetical protein
MVLYKCPTQKFNLLVDPMWLIASNFYKYNVELYTSMLGCNAVRTFEADTNVLEKHTFSIFSPT